MDSVTPRNSATPADDVARLFVRPPLNLAGDARTTFKRHVLEHLEQGALHFVFDFDHTGYIDSGGLGVLVSLSKRIRNAGGTLQLANLGEDLLALFEQTRLNTLFEIVTYPAVCHGCGGTGSVEVEDIEPEGDVVSVIPCPLCAQARRG